MRVPLIHMHASNMPALGSTMTAQVYGPALQPCAACAVQGICARQLTVPGCTQTCPKPLDKVRVLKEMIFPLCEKLGQTIIFVRTKDSARSLHQAVRGRSLLQMHLHQHVAAAPKCQTMICARAEDIARNGQPAQSLHQAVHGGQRARLAHCREQGPP